MEKEKVSRRHFFEALAYREFRTYFGIRCCFTFANQVQTTVLGFYVYQLSGSKLAIALIGLSEIIPALGIALYGGYIADKMEKRKILLMVYSGVLLTSVVTLIATANIGHVMSVTAILGILYAMLFLNGIARAFYDPAIFAVYTHSIPKELYAGANSWNNLSWQAHSILGPVAGGLIYAWGERPGAPIPGITATLATVILSILAALVLTSYLKKCPPVADPGEAAWKSIREGLQWLQGNKIMLYIMSLDLFSVLFGGVAALLPVYALDLLKTGAEGLGLMRMAMALGASLTMLALTRYSPMARPWRNLLITIAGFGLAIIGFGLSRYFPLSLVLLFAQGAFDSVSVVIRGTIVQLLTPETMRGRIAAINSMFIGSSAEIGDFESGMAAQLLGTVPAVVTGGALTLSIVIFTWWKTRALLPLSIEKISTPDLKDFSIKPSGVDSQTAC